MFGKPIDKPGGSGRAVREDMMIRAAMMTLTETVHVDLLDLSRTGAKLRGPDLPSPGQEVLLLLGRIETFGSVIWRDEDQCGIHFESALNERALAIVESERCSLLTCINGEAALAAVDWHNGLAR